VAHYTVVHYSGALQWRIAHMCITVAHYTVVHYSGALHGGALQWRIARSGSLQWRIARSGSLHVVAHRDAPLRKFTLST